MTKRVVCIVLLFCAAAVCGHAQTFTTLASFDGANGAHPYLGSLVQGTTGSMYGTAPYGGTAAYCNTGTGCGTLFEVSSGGVLTTLYSFCSRYGCFDGYSPFAGLTLATNGGLYGATLLGGGALNYGTIFEITEAGKLTTLHSFLGTDGAYPIGGLTQAPNGNLYATTGGEQEAPSYGTVFDITPLGSLTTIYDFGGTGGSYPNANLVEGTDGNFYGTTLYGGVGNSGTVFKISPIGGFTTLYSFCAEYHCTDGANPFSALVQRANGNFYGTTSLGGANQFGTIFEITPDGKLTTLHNFCAEANCADGSDSEGTLIIGTNGRIYGTTYDGGANGAGTIFEMTPSGKLTTVYSFCSETSCTDGSNTYAGLVQGTDGNLYGTTVYGGNSSNCSGGCGTVFRLSLGLGPFVETLPVSGRSGATATVLGNNLTGTTAVNFNGTAATFTVVSDTEITATVPSGATSGFLTVDTASGTLTSNRPFRVTP